MNILPVELRLRGHYDLELVCQCGRFSAWIRRGEPGAASVLHAVVIHARSCTDGRRNSTVARLEAERLRPTPRQEGLPL